MGFVRNGSEGTAKYRYTYREKFYVMANFSRFIRLGYQMIGVSDSHSSAAYDGLGTVVMVTVNSGSSIQTVTYSLQNFGSGAWKVTPHQTSRSQNRTMLPRFSVSGTQFTQTIPAQSVTTFVLTKGKSHSPVIGN